MLEAYFDETGHGEDTNVTYLGVAGCLTSVEVWKKVKDKWSAALRSEGLLHFHMNEFAFSTSSFKGWKKDEARRRRIYGALWEIIQAAELIPLGGFVRLEDFKRELAGQVHHVLRDAYFLCYLQCLRFLAQYAESEQVGNITTIFDNKKGYIGEALRIYDVLADHFIGKIPPPVFRDMRIFLPLQVADIIAYESKKEFERRLLTPELKPRWGFGQLENLISRTAPNKPAPFGDQDSSIALLSKEEMAIISAAQKKVHEE